MEEILELLKSTWRVLGITETIHYSCYAWVLFRQVQQLHFLDLVIKNHCQMWWFNCLSVFPLILTVTDLPFLVCHHKGARNFAACNWAIKENTIDGTAGTTREVTVEKFAFKGWRWKGYVFFAVLFNTDSEMGRPATWRLPPELFWGVVYYMATILVTWHVLTFNNLFLPIGNILSEIT